MEKFVRVREEGREIERGIFMDRIRKTQDASPVKMAVVRKSCL